MATVKNDRPRPVRTALQEPRPAAFLDSGVSRS